MNAVISWINAHFPYSNFFLGYLAATLLIGRHLTKRRLWGARLAAVLAVCIAVNALLRLLPGRSMLAVVCGILLLTMTALLFVCCELSLLQALFGALCAYAAEHLTNVIALLVQWAMGRWLHISEDSRVLHLSVYLVMFLLLEIFVFRNLQQNGKLRLKTRSTLVYGLILFLVVSILYSNILIAYYSNRGPLVLCAMVYDIICCGFFLLLQVSGQRSARLREDLEVERLLRKRQAEQYDMTRENISLIERKCHDLKHQIAALRSIDSPVVRDKSIREIEQAVEIYGAVMKTGSDVLDTVLTDKYLYCEQQGISWTCMADGSKLDFMDPVDLYVLFANALDNAIEAVRDLPDPERRSIRVTVYSKYNMAFLQIENDYAQPLDFQDDMPRTTKQDDAYHGFGLRSIRHTVEKYGGTMQIRTEQQVFNLHIVIPIPA